MILCLYEQLEQYGDIIASRYKENEYGQLEQIPVLVAKDGSFLKQIFECKETKKEAVLSSIAIFRPNSNIVTPTFLCYLLKCIFKIKKFIINICNVQKPCLLQPFYEYLLFS